MSELMFYLAHYYDKSKGQYVPFLYTNIAQNVLLDVESEETVADALTQLQNAKAHTLSELYAHIGNANIHPNAAQLQNALAAIAELIQHTDNNIIHVDKSDKDRWNKGVTIADEALTLILQLTEKLNLHEVRIARLEDALFSNITGNPFLISFDNLTGIQLVKGIWNEQLQRIEC